MEGNSIEMEVLYSPSKWVKRLPTTQVVDVHVAFTKKASQEVKETIPCELNIAYGKGPREKMDIIGTDLEGCPLVIFIHGGYWQEVALTHDNQSFVAKNLYKNGIKTICLGYELCPNVSMTDIPENISKAISKCLEYAKQHKTKDIYLIGHSAGAHLIAMHFAKYITKMPEEDQAMIKEVFMICGLYDLLPLLKTGVNAPLKMNEKTVVEVSPQLLKLVEGKGTVFHVICAEYDTPAFKQQAKIFHDHLISWNLKSHFLLLSKLDHFDIIERIVEEDFELTKYIIGRIQVN